MPKDTFIIRTEWKESILELEPVDQATILQNLFYFHSDNENLINLNNLSVKLVWKLIEPNLKRNADSYDKRKETSINNGKLGGRPKNLNKPNKPKETLNVIVSDNVIVPGSDTEKEKRVIPPTGDLFTLKGEELIKKKKDDFADKLKPFIEKFGKELCNDFWFYWTQPNEQKTKIRKDGEKYFDIAARLRTFHRNQNTKK